MRWNGDGTAAATATAVAALAAAAEMTKRKGQQEGLETHRVSSPWFFLIFYIQDSRIAPPHTTNTNTISIISTSTSTSGGSSGRGLRLEPLFFFFLFRLRLAWLSLLIPPCPYFSTMSPTWNSCLNSYLFSLATLTVAWKICFLHSTMLMLLTYLLGYDNRLKCLKCAWSYALFT